MFYLSRLVEEMPIFCRCFLHFDFSQFSSYVVIVKIFVMNLHDQTDREMCGKVRTRLSLDYTVREIERCVVRCEQGFLSITRSENREMCGKVRTRLSLDYTVIEIERCVVRCEQGFLSITRSER